MTNPQYYCYQCANQTQVDPTEFVCKRCGGGFIQEMPADPTPPPRDPLPPATTSAATSGTTASLSGFRQFGMPAASTSQASQTNLDGDDLMSPSFQLNTHQQTNVQPQSHPFFTFAPHQSMNQPCTHPHHHHHQQMQSGPLHTPHMQGQSSGGNSMGPFSPGGFPFGPLPPNAIPHTHTTHMVSSQRHPQPSSSNTMLSFGLPGTFNPSFGPAPPSFTGQPNTGQQQHIHQHPAPHYHFMSSQQPNQPNEGGNPSQGNFMMVGVDMNGNPAQAVNIPGNMNNLMQMLTENIDDVITAVLNQLGTQGGPPPMTQQLVDAIPSRPATSEMIVENRTCSICMDNFTANSSYKEMPCNHQFHGSCIDRWLILHGNCPVCRTNVQTGEPAGTDNDHGGIQEVNVMYQVEAGPAPPPMFAPHAQHFHAPPQRFAQPPAPGNFFFRPAHPHQPVPPRPVVNQGFAWAGPRPQNAGQFGQPTGARLAGPATMWSGQLIVGQGQPGQQSQMHIFVNPAQEGSMNSSSAGGAFFGQAQPQPQPPPSSRLNTPGGSRPTRVRQPLPRTGQPRSTLRAPTGSPQQQPQPSSNTGFLGTIVNSVANALSSQLHGGPVPSQGPVQPLVSQTSNTTGVLPSSVPSQGRQVAFDVAASGDSVANSGSGMPEPKAQPKDDMDLD